MAQTMSEREIAKEFSTIKGALLWKCPFIGSLISAARLRIFELPGAIAAVDKGRTIYINPNAWSGLSRGEKLGVIAHEVLHLAFRHAYRIEKAGYDPQIYNVAADACVNHILGVNGFDLPRGSIALTTISDIVDMSVDQLAKLTADSIYKLIEGKVKKIKIPIEFGEGEGGVSGVGKDLRPDLGGDEEKAGEEGEGGGKVDWGEYWREAVSRAVVVAKQAGKIPAGMERVFDILKPKVDWRIALREALMFGFRKIISSYRRISRKCPDLPGHRRMGVGRGWIMIDCSGSIGREELSQFASEVYAISKKFSSELIILPWDVEVYEAQKVKSPSDITRVKLKGGGGTCILNAAEKVAKEMKPRDFVIVLTDGFIYDIENEEVQARLAEISSKASTAIFVSNAADVRLPPRWRFIKIE